MIEVKKSTITQEIPLTPFAKGGQEIISSLSTDKFVYREPSEMKDSGIEWIGLIPKDWEVTKLKYLAKICNGKEQSLVLDENGKYPILGTGGVFGRSNKFLYNKPSVLLGRKGTIDKPKYIEEPFWTVDTLFYTEIKNIINYKLFFYLCKTINFGYYSTQTALPSMTQEDLSTVPFVIVKKIKEQTKIANFLDQKTSEFDNMISKKESIINKLEEAKKSLISETVTGKVKIVNNEIIQRDKIEMKDSGIEWIGFIPKEWIIGKLKYYLESGRTGIRIGPFGSSLKLEEMNEYYPIKVYGQENLINEDFNLGHRFINEDKFREMCQYQVFYKDILISMMGTIGKSMVTPENIEKGIIDSHLIKIRVNEIKISPYYLNFIIRYSSYVKEQLNLNSKGSIMSGLNSTIIKNLILFVPSIEEQTKIANFLDQKTSEFDNMIEKQKRIIKKIKEAKQSLISEAVTGKIKII